MIDTGILFQIHAATVGMAANASRLLDELKELVPSQERIVEFGQGLASALKLLQQVSDANRHEAWRLFSQVRAGRSCQCGSRSYVTAHRAAWEVLSLPATPTSSIGEWSEFKAQLDYEYDGAVTIIQTAQPAQPPADVKSLAPAARLAYTQHANAMRINSSLKIDKDVFDWLKCQGELPGEYGAWVRNLRRARKALGEQKNTSRHGRQGRSVAGKDQVNQI